MRMLKPAAAVLCAVTTLVVATAVSAQAAPQAGAQALDVRAVHSRILALDMHMDLPDGFGRDGRSALSDPSSLFDLDRVRSGGLNAVTIAISAPQRHRTPEELVAAKADAEYEHETIIGLATAYPDRVGLALSPDDVRRIAAQGKLAIIQSILNAQFVDKVDDFDAWYAKGIRVIGFTHAGHNALSDSSRPILPWAQPLEEHHGLSDLGRAAVTRLNDLGIVIDVSQVSDAAFDQILAQSRAPVIASHSGIRSISDNPRNLTDAQLDALKANGGVIGIVSFRAYLYQLPPEIAAQVKALQKRYGLSTTNGAVLNAEQTAAYTREYYEITGRSRLVTVQDLGDSIDYAVRRIGIDHVGISSDFNHGGGSVGWAGVGETRGVTKELLRRGYSEADIGKLWSGNFLRVWQQAIDARRGATDHGSK